MGLKTGGGDSPEQENATLVELEGNSVTIGTDIVKLTKFGN